MPRSLAAVLACGRGALASHGSAASSMGNRTEPVASRCTSRRRGVGERSKPVITAASVRAPPPGRSHRDRQHPPHQPIPNPARSRRGGEHRPAREGGRERGTAMPLRPERDERPDRDGATAATVSSPSKPFFPNTVSLRGLDSSSSDSSSSSVATRDCLSHRSTSSSRIRGGCLLASGSPHRRARQLRVPRDSRGVRARQTTRRGVQLAGYRVGAYHATACSKTPTTLAATLRQLLS